MPIGPASGFLDFTNATPRANVIVALSNIGIGTDVPLHAFDLRGTANVADIIINNDLTLTGGLTTNSLTINSMSMSTTSNFQQVTNVGNVTTNTVEFTNPTTGLAVTSNVEVGGELSVSGNVEVGTDNLFVDTTTGNVGVGTTDPARAFEITRPGGGAIINLKRSDFGTGQGALAFVNGYSNVAASITCSRSGSEGGEILFYTVPNDTTQTSDNPYQIPERMRINKDGNVGIGTDSPGALLELSKATGSATISPTELRLSTRTNAADWSVTDPWARLAFYTNDLTGDAPGVMASVGAVASSVDGGENTRLAFFTAEPHVERMCVDRYGNVGIGTASPGSTSYAPGTSLHLFNGSGISSSYSGSILSSSNKPRTSLIFQKYTASPNASAWGEVIGFISLNWMPYRSTRPFGVGMYGQRDSYAHDDQADMHFFVTNGGYDTDVDALVIDGTGGSQSTVTTNGSTVTSDDRLKTGETVIRNALKSIKKLTPQLYAKHPFYGSFSELKDNVKCESGLIVQDVWYDAPEFRHLVMKDKSAIPANEKPIEPVPGDITVDPDYSDWGDKPASLNYTGFIPYIISSIKELCDEIPHRKISAPREIFSNIEQYHGLIVSKRGDDISPSSRVKDKSVYGVVSETQPKDVENSEIYVKSHGEEGRVWIINTSNLEAGDYITTSNVVGYGQKQDSDFLTNYTVAKITMDCDFTQPNVPVRKCIQQVQDVNYWVYKHRIGISKEAYDTLSDKDRCITTQEIYKLNGEQIFSTTSNVFDSNTNTYKEVTLNPEDVPGAERETITQYCKIDRVEFKKEIPGLDLEVRQELVNVLDANGQLQWEDDPSGATEPAYKIRYLDADGNITDEANAVHTAAFVGCTYHCG